MKSINIPREAFIKLIANDRCTFVDPFECKTCTVITTLMSRTTFDNELYTLFLTYEDINKLINIKSIINYEISIFI
jgi:hypothetical protein